MKRKPGRHRGVPSASSVPHNARSKARRGAAITASFAAGLLLAGWAFHIYDQTLVGAGGFIAAALLSGGIAALLTGRNLGSAPLRVIFFICTLGSVACFAILAANYYPRGGATTLERVPIVERTTIGRQRREMFVINLAGQRKLLGEYPGNCSDKSLMTAVVAVQRGFLGLPILRGYFCE